MIDKDKKYKVSTMYHNQGIGWIVTRIGHRTRGDYILATFYDRGAIQIFTEALEYRDFVEVKDEETK